MQPSTTGEIALAEQAIRSRNFAVKPAKPQSGVLQQHLKKGNTFYPLYTFKDGRQQWNLIDWRRDYVPELIWLGLLVDKYGYEEAKRLACELGVAAQRNSAPGIFYDFGTISGFARLSGAEHKALQQSIKGTALLRKLKVALKPLIELYPCCPLSFFIGAACRKNPSPAAINAVGPIVGKFLFRHERLPMLAQAIHYGVSVASGKHHVSSTEPDVDKIKDYPDAPGSDEIAGFIRTHVTGMTAMGWTNVWAKQFWARGRKLGPCRAAEDTMVHLGDMGGDFLHYHVECFGNFYNRSKLLWQQVERRYEFDLYAPLRDEVLLALVCRIYRLAVQVASFLPNWVEDISEIYVRLVVESYINYQWLKKHGTPDHFEKFYMFGLGQQKLRGEHLNAYFASHGLTAEEAEEVNPGVDFLRKHRMPSFVPVNIGNWLDKDLRRIAEEANCKEIYSLMYSACSSAVHGNYDSLERFFLRACTNPFHRLHQLPYYWAKSPLSAFGVGNALNICDLVLSELVTSLGGKLPKRMPGATFMDEITSPRRFRRFKAKFQSTGSS